MLCASLARVCDIVNLFMRLFHIMHRYMYFMFTRAMHAHRKIKIQATYQIILFYHLDREKSHCAICIMVHLQKKCMGTIYNIAPNLFWLWQMSSEWVNSWFTALGYFISPGFFRMWPWAHPSIYCIIVIDRTKVRKWALYGFKSQIS